MTKEERTQITRLGKLIQGTRTRRKGTSNRRWDRRKKRDDNWTRLKIWELTDIFGKQCYQPVKENPPSKCKH